MYRLYSVPMTSKQLLSAAWAVAVAGVLGSLYFSQVLRLPPCDLCWYQRIFLYPLAVIIPIGIARGDNRLGAYVVPPAAIGAVIAAYHTLLQYQVIPAELAPCASGVSCATVQFELFGFVTIPLLSLIGFLLIIGFVILSGRKERSDGQ